MPACSIFIRTDRYTATAVDFTPGPSTHDLHNTRRTECFQFYRCVPIFFFPCVVQIYDSLFGRCHGNRNYAPGSSGASAVQVVVVVVVLQTTTEYAVIDLTIPCPRLLTGATSCRRRGQLLSCAGGTCSRHSRYSRVITVRSCTFTTVHRSRARPAIVIRKYHTQSLHDSTVVDREGCNGGKKTTALNSNDSPRYRR